MNDSRTPERDGDELLVAELRDTFEALATAYEPRPLPAHLWQQGRREGRSARLQVVAASVVLLALLAGTLMWGRAAQIGPADVPVGGALPQVMHVPSYEQVEEMVADGKVSRTLDVGALSLTSVLSNRYVLGVGARDGEHLLLDLPQLDPATATASQAVSLSPDGQFLAWPYVDTTDPGGESSGVQVVDLSTGGVTGFPLTSPGGLPVRVRVTTWSPDGSRVGLAGNEYVPGDGTEGESVVGVVDPTSSAPVATTAMRTGWLPTIAVADEGTLHVLSSEEGHLRLAPGDEPVVVGSLAQEDDEPLGSALSPDGEWLAVGGRGDGTFSSWELPTSASSGKVRTRAWVVETAEVAIRALAVRGWSPDGSVLGLVDTAAGLGLYRLAPGGAVDLVVDIRMEESTFGEAALSVASGLADAEPVDFPTPGWAPGPDRWPWAGLFELVAGAAVVVGLVLARRRRGRTESSGSRSPEGSSEMNERSFISRTTAGNPGGWLSSRITRPGAGRRWLGIAGTLALAVGLAVAVAPMRPRADGPFAQDGALPVRVHSPTGWAAENPENAVPSDLAVGRLAALTGNSWEPSLAVSATDGAHLFIEPDQSDLTGMDDFAPRLSPDGTRIAGLWSRLDDETVKSEAGLAVTDLRTGEVEQVTLRGPNGRPVRVEQVSWSSDGTHLAWYGDEAVQWDTGGSSFHGERRMVGITAATGLRDTSWQVEKGNRPAAVAAAPDGTGALVIGRRLWTFSADAPAAPLTSRIVSPAAQEWSGGAVSGDGRTLAVGLDATNGYVSGLRLLDLTATDAQVQPVAWEQRDPVLHTHALGFTPEGRLVVAGQSAGSRFNGDGVVKVAVVDRPTDAATDPRVVTTVESSGPRSVSVATALADRDPVAFAPPRWPTSIERKVVAAFLAAGLALSLGLAVRGWRRRRTT